MKALYDPSDVVCLGHAHAVLAIREDGTPWPWLLGGDDDDPQGCYCGTCAPHEQVGRLPRDVLRRINQCQAIGSTTGRRCTRPVPLGQRYCAQHAGVSADG